MRKRKQAAQELPKQQEPHVGKDQRAVRINAATLIITKKSYDPVKRAAHHIELVEESRKRYAI